MVIMQDMLTNKPPLKKGNVNTTKMCFLLDNQQHQTNTCLFGRFEDLLDRCEKALIKMEGAVTVYNNLKMSRSFRDSHKITSRLEDIEENNVKILKSLAEIAYRVSSKPLDEKELLRREFEDSLEK